MIVIGESTFFTRKNRSTNTNEDLYQRKKFDQRFESDTRSAAILIFNEPKFLQMVVSSLSLALLKSTMSMSFFFIIVFHGQTIVSSLVLLHNNESIHRLLFIFKCQFLAIRFSICLSIEDCAVDIHTRTPLLRDQIQRFRSRSRFISSSVHRADRKTKDEIDIRN